MEQDRKLRNNHTHTYMANEFTTKKARLHNDGKTISSTNGAGKTGHLYVKK